MRSLGMARDLIFYICVFFFIIFFITSFYFLSFLFILGTSMALHGFG